MNEMMINTNITRRTLVRICAVDKEKRLVAVCIPSWNPHKLVDVALDVFPQDSHEDLNSDIWLFGYVNTGAEEAQDLIFECIEKCLHSLSESDEFVSTDSVELADIDANNSCEVHESWLDEIYKKRKSLNLVNFAIDNNLDYLSVFWFFKGNPVVNTEFDKICTALGLEAERVQGELIL